MTHAMPRQATRCPFREPMSSIPEEILSTLRLGHTQIRQIVFHFHLCSLELRSLVSSVTTMHFFKRGKSGKSGVKKNTWGWIFGTQGRLRTWPNKKALTPRTQWQERWCSHGDWWSYSPSEMPYRNLEWKKDKNTFNPVKKSKLSLKVSKLHTGKRNNATTETEEWNGGGAFARFS